MADTTINQLTTVIPRGNSLIPISHDNTTVNTLASSLTADCISRGTQYSVEFLIVGGGGAGGQDYGGGGGAGGFVEGTTQLNVGRTYHAVVGLGGTREYLGILNKNGSDSSFNGIIAYGGGKGGGHNSYNDKAGSSGGSGGGPYRGYNTVNSNGKGVFGQGHNASLGSADYGGAGGGAGSIPVDSTNGGLGKYSSITGTNTYYASGGNVLYATTVIQPDKPANTGYGGDANWGVWGAAGGGGSGIVVIAYPGTPRGTAYLNSTTIIAPDTASRPGFTVHKFLQGGYYIA